MSQATPPSRVAAVRRVYDARSEEYDTSQVHLAQSRDYIQWAGLAPGQNVLDLATGTGLVAIEAKKIVGSSGLVLGVDVSQGMLDVAKRKAEKQGVDVKWINSDIANLRGLEVDEETKDVRFDLITCASALILLSDPLAAVRGWAESLKPRGRIITDVQTRDANLVMNIFASMASEIGTKVPWEGSRWTSMRDLDNLMVDAGLTVLQLWETPVYATTKFTVHEAEVIFDDAVTKPMYSDFGKDKVRHRAKELFSTRMLQIASGQEEILEECKYWVVVAEKQ